MVELTDFLHTTFAGLDLTSIVDILVVAAIAYGLLSLIQGTTGVALLRGVIVVLLAGSLVSSLLGLTVLGWLLRNTLPALLVAIPILFQPELRRALEHVGRGRGIIPWSPWPTGSQRAVTSVPAAAGDLSRRGWGGLIVLERETPLGEYHASGTRIDADLSAELLVTLFSPHSPLHDGAIIVRGDRVLAAGCILPLSETFDSTIPAQARRNGSRRELGMRHRAGIGITEKTDALSIIVSEETGHISLANNGRVVSDLDEDRLRRTLSILYKPRPLGGGATRLRIRAPSRNP